MSNKRWDGATYTRIRNEQGEAAAREYLRDDDEPPPGLHDIRCGHCRAQFGSVDQAKAHVEAEHGKKEGR